MAETMQLEDFDFIQPHLGGRGFLKLDDNFIQQPYVILSSPSPNECGGSTLTVSLVVIVATPLVLFITELFHPVGGFSVELLLNGDGVIAVVGFATCQCLSPG